MWNCGISRVARDPQESSSSSPALHRTSTTSNAQPLISIHYIVLWLKCCLSELQGFTTHLISDKLNYHYGNKKLNYTIMKTTMNYTKLSFEVILGISCLEATDIWANMSEHPKTHKVWRVLLAPLTCCLPISLPDECHPIPAAWTDNSADKMRVFPFPFYWGHPCITCGGKEPQKLTSH